MALQLKEDGLLHDSGRCTLCGICGKVCPVRSIRVEK
jgi:NAD-dependent dihydropyrimidine dehydrogenase PreA subunit